MQSCQISEISSIQSPDGINFYFLCFGDAAFYQGILTTYPKIGAIVLYQKFIKALLALNSI